MTGNTLATIIPITQLEWNQSQTAIATINGRCRTPIKATRRPKKSSETPAQTQTLEGAPVQTLYDFAEKKAGLVYDLLKNTLTCITLSTI